MDQNLIALALKSRDSYFKIIDHITLDRHSPITKKLFQLIDEYYQRDESATHVDTSVLISLLKERLTNDKHVDQFREVIAEASSLDISVPNTELIILESKKSEIGYALAQALVEKREDDALIEEFLNLREATSLNQLKDEPTALSTGDLRTYLSQVLDTSNRMGIYPEVVNARLDGGAARGHHITVFGRPESGKTATVINIMCGLARQGFKGIYCGNEDKDEDIFIRIISNLSGYDRFRIGHNMDEAIQRARDNGLDNITVIHGFAPGSPRQIENLIKEYEPSWVVVDQLRNLSMKNESRVDQLEKAATALRNLGKKYNLLMISVTQAGDSASGKAVLDMGDVDYSNTGIPAAADVMLGVGMSPEQDRMGLRTISFPKNKISGFHGEVVVRLIPQLSRLVSA